MAAVTEARDATLLRPALAPAVDRLLGVRPATVVAAWHETPTIRAIELNAPDGYHHHAGQFLALRLATDAGPDVRPLSIASPPGAARLQLATRLGPSPFKRAVARLDPGDEVRISRPLGRYRFDIRRPAIVVTGGIGITPIRSMLLDALARGFSHPVRLLCSNHSPAETPYRAELTALAAGHPNVRITWIDTAGPHGARIDRVLLAPHLAELPDARVYLTGPAAMVADLTDVARREGVPRRRLRATRQTAPTPRRRPHP